MSWPLEPWWAPLTPGETVALAFVKLDRVGSTLDWNELPESEVQRRRARFIAGIEQLGQDFGAVQPLHWQGDGVLLVFPCRDEGELVLAWKGTRALWERQTFELNMPTRFALHAATDVTWEPDTGKLAHPAIDLCGHLEHDAPEKAVAVTEDVFLALPERERRELAWLGVTKRDGVAAYVFPAASAARRKPEAFGDDTPGKLWRRFREHAHSAPVRRLRYAGLRLTKKEPPSLDVLRVFVAPRLSVRRPAPDLFDDEFAGSARIDESDVVASASVGAGPRPTHASHERQQDRASRSRLPRVEPEVALADALRRSRALVVLGEPGSGKTTLLRWLAVVAAGGRLTFSRETGLAERLLPLPVSVGRLAEIRTAAGGDISVVDALARYFEDRSVGARDELVAFLRAALETGECLVLLDGLDEVKSADHRAVAEWLESFAAIYARNRFVVTSRPTGYTPFALPNGVEVSLQPFEDAQVERYVAEFQRAYLAWETNAEQPALAGQQTHHLLEALRNSPRLRDLARNPFLLSVLALIHRAEGRLPRHRVQAYQVVAQALCETWGSARRLVAAPSQPDIAYEEEALPVLGELAIALHAEYPDGLAPEAWMLSTLARALVERRGVPESEARRAAREFLSKVAENVGLLVERAAGHWGFLHLTFQEFFVAVGLHAQERFEEEAFAHLFDPRWEEVIRLGVGHLALVQGRPEAARRIVRKVLEYRLEGDLSWVTDILKKQIPLAALLAAEAGEALPPDDRRTVAQTFLEWLRKAPSDEGRVLVVGRRQVEEIKFTALAEQVHDELASMIRRDPRASEIVGEIVRALRADAAVPALLANLEAGQADFLDELMRPLAFLKVEAAVPLLIRLAETSDSYASDALFALVEIASPAALEAVVRALERGNADAAEALLRDPGMAEGPLMRALGSPDADTRWWAALALLGLRPEPALATLRHELGERGLHQRPSLRLPTFVESAIPVLLPALHDPLPDLRVVVLRYLTASQTTSAPRATLELLDDRHPGVRAAAAAALATRSFAVPRLIRALADPEPAVRRAAVNALQQAPTEEVMTALRKQLEDEDLNVRLDAAGILGRNMDTAAERTLLRCLAHADVGIRARATNLLAECGTDTAHDAVTGAVSDPDSQVRRAALRVLGLVGHARSVKCVLSHLRTTLLYSEREAAHLALWRIAERINIARGLSLA